MEKKKDRRQSESERREIKQKKGITEILIKRINQILNEETYSSKE